MRVAAWRSSSAAPFSNGTASPAATGRERSHVGEIVGIAEASDRIYLRDAE
jgi:hypothetical protein